MNVCGLSRLHCQRCQQETLHKNGATCVHCGTRFEVVVPENRVSAHVQQMRAVNERRARARRRAKARLSIA